MTFKRATILLLTLALLTAGLSAGLASDRDEATITVEVSSADHEIQEGYFTLGQDVTVMVKPDSELHRFLTRHRGRKVKISMSEATVPELSRLER
jgi:hypothetical protein